MFSGSIPALVTLFKNDKVDDKGMRKFIDWQIAEGASGLVPVGTTGESPTLTHEEHRHVVELTVEAAAGRVPVIAGAGSNSTREAISFARHAEKVGSDGVLVVTPYYNKPSQEGLFCHYRAIAEATSLPLIIYNIPGRSVVDMSVETMKRLVDSCPTIIGVKDATGDIERVSLQREAIGKDFCQLSGEDMAALSARALGSSGCISVTGNVAPRLLAEMHKACDQGDYKTALEIQDRLVPLHRALFAETSPAPVKYALSLLGHGDSSLRLPLVPITEATRQAVRKAMINAGLIN
ncbi:hypothetical protein CAPTEDRAFT_126918 [Capitella teleta]|uniref:4-hydroxy-2-oxoglutarate aldolase, mitochondrial n=1 Tax=Capitella teleta TaxID=283909 RepID=R7UXF7_CAPTE|nr:hypothetical protein CAPTEDRAFT_126918 [Capitella teleta]|eukprot:ELU11263.1 hypothetical protein CAPTEDRAFT_126918 [Capitella teleta]